MIDLFSLKGSLSILLDSLSASRITVCPSLLLEWLLVVLGIFFTVVPRLPCHYFSVSRRTT
jgi:hypothetical protein